MGERGGEGEGVGGRNAQQENKGTSKSQEQKQEQHLPIRHAGRPADLVLATFHFYRVINSEVRYEVRLHQGGYIFICIQHISGIFKIWEG